MVHPYAFLITWYAILVPTYRVYLCILDGLEQMRTGHTRDSTIDSMMDLNVAERMNFPVDLLGLHNVIGSLASPHSNVCTLASGVIWSLLCIKDVWNPAHCFPLEDLLQALVDLGRRCMGSGARWHGPAVTLRCVSL